MSLSEISQRLVGLRRLDPVSLSAKFGSVCWLCWGDEWIPEHVQETKIEIRTPPRHLNPIFHLSALGSKKTEVKQELSQIFNHSISALPPLVIPVFTKLIALGHEVMTHRYTQLARMKSTCMKADRYFITKLPISPKWWKSITGFSAKPLIAWVTSLQYFFLFNLNVVHNYNEVKGEVHTYFYMIYIYI